VFGVCRWFPSDPLQAIEDGLRSQPGIYSVQVALLAERAVVEYDPVLWTDDKIAEVRPSAPA
jgi:hypothetical protein